MFDMTEPVVIATVFLGSTVVFAALGLVLYALISWTRKEQENA